MQIRTLTLAAACLWLYPVPSPALVTSTFDAGPDGWAVGGDATSTAPTYSAAGGNPTGYIRANDTVSGGTWYFIAPAKFLGNAAAAYGQNLSFDLTQQITGGPDPFNNSDVLLTGAGISLAFDTPVNPAYYPLWTSYAVPLRASAGWRVTNLTGAPATEAQMQAVLANLTALRIRGEYQTGADTGGLDNVVLRTALPGDADGDGDVDLDDQGIWAANFTGSLAPGAGSSTFGQGDFDADKDVDLDDQGIWAANFTGSLAPSALASVPEPGAVLPAGALVMAWLCQMRSRRQNGERQQAGAST